jgi:hypothetical protein
VSSRGVRSGRAEVEKGEEGRPPLCGNRLRKPVGLGGWYAYGGRDRQEAALLLTAFVRTSLTTSSTKGKKEFGLGGFSIQEVVDKIIDRGYFSHALPQ